METDAELRFKVFGLFMDCPNSGKRKDCPLKDIRRLPTEDKEALVDSWDMKKIKDTLAVHQDCLCSC